MICELYVGVGTAYKHHYTCQYVCCIWNIVVLCKIWGPYFSYCRHYCYGVPCGQ